MDLLALLIGVAAIVSFAVSLSQRPQPPVYQLVIAPEPSGNTFASLLTAGVIAIAMIIWLLAGL